jgi:hypothetical protein
MPSNAPVSEDNQIRDFLDEYERTKGDYDREQYDKLVKVVTELENFLKEANAGGVFSTGRYIEKTGEALQNLGADMWTAEETAKILTEAIQKESSTEKED